MGLRDVCSGSGHNLRISQVEFRWKRDGDVGNGLIMHFDTVEGSKFGINFEISSIGKPNISPSEICVEFFV